MKNQNNKKKLTNKSCVTGQYYSISPKNKKSSSKVSISRESKWEELTNKVIHENIGAWKTLSKE